MPPRVILIVVLLAVIMYVVSIVDCAAQPATRHRGVSKSAWMFIVILLPVVGGILWFAVGRGRAVTASGGRRFPQAPDDNVEFLRSLGSTSEQDERIRRLEEELAKLDDENTSPSDDEDDQRGPAS